MTDRELMQMALDALMRLEQDTFHPAKVFPYRPAIIALRARLAQPEQRSGDCLLTGVCASEGHRIEKAQPEPEPVAWKYETPDYVSLQWEPTRGDWRDGTWTPLYTAPPQRPWQGLTDEEAEHIYAEYWNDVAMFIEAIEAKLKEKNT